MSEIQHRVEAIRRVAQGESVTDVCVDLGRSRGWYYKWLNVFQSAGVEGLTRQRGGQVPSNATPGWLKELIVEIRDRLVEQAQAGTSFQGVGARQVVSELEKLSIHAPHWTTVHRILKRAGRIALPTRYFGYCPRPIVNGLNSVHQIDIWPRVLQGGKRLHFFHLIDVACWYPHGAVTIDKTTDTALDFLVKCWQMLGLPQIAQFDNEMSFTGGRWAHRLGRVVRLCLALGVKVWFIPFHTPQRNGFVERFHGECDQFFWSRCRFENVPQVQAAYPAFLDYFRHQRRLPAIQNHTPAKMRASWSEIPVRHLHSGFRLQRRKRLPLVEGTIYCVRLSDRHGQVNVLNHHIALGSAYAKHYVLARIDTAHQQMTLYYQPDAESEPKEVQSCPFPLREPVLPFDPAFNYSISDG